ncbi:MAG TPA: class II fructose-bisphosphate aldolase [Candidatus Paceibacterota bacterium]|nr:class II fructose-bisphosphate aldolase [Candidatus Paceibacterota bacterium]
MVESLREAIKEAEEKGVAIGHFNVSDSEAVHAIFNAAKKLNVPVIIGVSEGERDFIGVNQVRALIDSLKKEHGYPIYLNADHTYSFERVKEVIDAGFDAVIFDGTKVSAEENVKLAKKSVEYARSSGKDILVEAELGYIGTSSKLLDEVPEGAEITEDKLVKPEDAKKFVDETGVDLLAPAVGNLHGMLKNAANPALDIERIKAIRETAGVPLVLHGGSGISYEDFQKAIKAGISIVHINTAIRVAYKEGIEEALEQNPDDIAPYRFMKEGVENMEEVVERYLRLFNFLT